MAAWKPAGSRHRLPPGVDRPREHLPQRQHPGDDPPRNRREFDEIVDFSEIEKFLDTPVEALFQWNVRAPGLCGRGTLEPEILIVDEVSQSMMNRALRTKCLGKMHEVADEGRTVSLSVIAWKPYNGCASDAFC